jgi:small subunit ribosomal protein S16
MLAIRMQRTGRKGHAQFRLIVQESRRTPSSGNIVAALGSYDPHTKVVILDKEKASTYLHNGAQPSPRMAMIMQKEGITLPTWVKIDNSHKASIKNTTKLRRNAPVEEVATKEVEPVEEVTEETPQAEAAPVEESPKEETVAESEAKESETPADTTEKA